MAASGGLKRLSEAGGVDFPAIAAARARTERGLVERRETLAGLARHEDVAIVLMGSWGRLEVTGGSDDDFMCLVDADEREEVEPGIEAIWEALGRHGKPPGKTEVFGVPVFSANLRTVGLEDDGNKNLTRRQLLLLESQVVAGEEVYREVKSGLLAAYLAEHRSDFRPPRYLLNDVIRYWRTIAVDFEAKHRDRHGEEWGLRNAKLRTARPLLFAGGLLPLLECHRVRAPDAKSFLADRLEAAPTDRVATCFLEYERVDSGVRAMLAYDSFLTLLDEPAARSELESLAVEDRDSSPVFAEAKRLGQEIRGALLSLLFETRELYELTREYAIF